MDDPEYRLFIMPDTEPDYEWRREMLQCQRELEDDLSGKSERDRVVRLSTEAKLRQTQLLAGYAERRASGPNGRLPSSVLTIT